MFFTTILSNNSTTLLISFLEDVTKIGLSKVTIALDTLIPFKYSPGLKAATAFILSLLVAKSNDKLAEYELPTIIIGFELFIL